QRPVVLQVELEPAEAERLPQQMLRVDTRTRHALTRQVLGRPPENLGDGHELRSSTQVAAEPGFAGRSHGARTRLTLNGRGLTGETSVSPVPSDRHWPLREPDVERRPRAPP